MSSEVQSRPAAPRGGRGAARGGRGGFGGRGSTRRTNGDTKHDETSAAVEDEGEIGQLKKLYGAKTTLIKELFPDWSEVDILFALRETDGDENLTVTRIAEGTISQWDEVSKPKKERTKPKAKESAATGDAPSARAARSGGAGPEKTRGRASARAAERGGRSARGRSTQPPNGTRPEKNPLSVPTEESQAWDSTKSGDDATATLEQNSAPTSTDAPTSVPAGAAPKTWASMLRQSTAPPPKPIAKPKETPPVQKPATDTVEPLSPSSATAPAAATAATTSASPSAAEPEPAAEEAPEKPATQEDGTPEVAVPTIVVPEATIPPSQDQLTESNLEQVVDISHPPETDTNRSETADSWDPRASALPGTSTPLSASQQQHQQQHGASKALGSGYAASAIKATDRTAIRTPSYSRRILDQEEAVRMPVNRDVDRATVQFGALNFNGGVDDDIDGDREEPETRAQPPDDSPVAHPRASLPPVAPPAAVSDAFAAQKQAATTPSTVPNLPTSAAAPVPTAPAAAVSQAQPAAQNTQQYGRYGQTASQETTFGQKPFDAYGQPSQTQASTNPQYDSFQSLPASAQAPAQQPPTAYSSAPNEYSQYFTSDAQSRVPYNNYYQAYGQQAAQGHQDGAQNQRSYGGYPLGDSLSQYPQSNASRFGGGAAASSVAADAQNSGTSTPNPPAAGQQQQSQQQQQTGAQSQHAQQQHQGSQYPSYSQHPYYASPYYAQYVTQQQYGAFGQGNYGAPYGKGGYGGAHHPYGMSPQTPYDHSAASQASGFSGASSLHRGADSSALGSSGLSDYGRVGAGQSVSQQSGFGGGHEGSFGRGGAASYQSQSGQGYGAQQSQVGAQQAGSDDLKPYGDSKGAAGPSPSLARPGSATNTQSTQSGLPPPQSSQQGGVSGYGGYPAHLQSHGSLHGNQPATGGGYAANQSYGNNPYGSHGGHGAHGGHGGQGFSGNSYYNNQQRGWGGNYH